MKRKLVILFMAACGLFFASCGNAYTLPTIIPSETPNPSITSTPKPIPSLTKRIYPTFTPTPTYPPYKNKPILLEYGINGGHGLFEDVLSPYVPNLVLMNDGQLIIKGNPYKEKVLSGSEIQGLLSQLTKKGLYSIKTNEELDASNPLYNFGNNFFEVTDGVFICVSIHNEKPRSICSYEPYKDYLIPSMKNLLQFIDRYNPDNMTVYHPDRIILERQYGDELTTEVSQSTPIKWPSNLPPLISNPRIYAEGETAVEIFALFDYSDKPKLFIENGSIYTVFIRPILPSEVITQP